MTESAGDRELDPFPSAALQAANQRLMALRTAAQQHHAASGQHHAAAEQHHAADGQHHAASGQHHHAHTAAAVSAASPTSPASPAPLALEEVFNQLPPHLGWHSAAATAVIRQGQTGRQGQPGRSSAPASLSNQTPPPTAVGPSVEAAAKIGCTLTPTAVGPSVEAAAETGCILMPTAVGPSAEAAAQTGCILTPTAVGPLEDETLKLHPSLALAMLQAGQAAPGRLWLLLRWLDENGRGCLPLTEVRSALTRKGSATRLCGQRQLRALLHQGDGLFWRRDKTHVWLSSTVNVAARLGVVRLSGRPIALPLTVLLEPIGLVRAHFYASFHSSRLGEGGQEGAPISRAALMVVSGISRRTQHAYEARARVRTARNIAIEAPLGRKTAAVEKGAAEEAAWQHGRAAFILTDRKGIQGKPGQRYLARQLPNSYSGPHATLGRGRQRQLNHQLADLRRYGDVGNDHVMEASLQRRYADNGALAGRWLKRQPEASLYWRGRRGRGTSVWYVLSGKESGR